MIFEYVELSWSAYMRYYVYLYSIYGLSSRIYTKMTRFTWFESYIDMLSVISVLSYFPSDMTLADAKMIICGTNTVIYAVLQQFVSILIPEFTYYNICYVSTYIRN